MTQRPDEETLKRSKDENPNIDRKQTPKEDLKDAPQNNRTLEEGLEDSMDGSDPPSSTQP